jgi:hypothetical protein
MKSLAIMYCLLVLMAVVGSGCGWISSQTDSGSSDSTVTTTTEGDQVFSIDISKDFSYTVSGDSGLAGVSLLVPAGTLSVPVDFTLSEGGDMASLASLDFDEISEAESASLAVSLSAESDEIQIGNTMTLSIPLSSADLNLSSLKKMAVIYVYRKDNAIVTGFISQENFKTYSSSSVTIDVNHWGTYQVIKVADSVNVSEISEKSEIYGSTLTGQWETPCHSEDLDGRPDNYYKDSLIISGLSISYKGTSFSNSSCITGVENYIMSARGSFVTRNSSVSSEFSEIDIMIANIFIRPMSQMIVTDFNFREVCGFNDWKVGESKMVEKCEQLETPEPGDTIKDIFYVDERYLILGESTSSYNSRANSLEVDVSSHFVKSNN